LWSFWIGVFLALLLVLMTGLEQHFGGLKASYQYFMTYEYPKHHELPPEFMKKLSSDRIFASFFYPNALAGGVLLFLQPTVAVLWRTQSFTKEARIFIFVVFSAGPLVCLF